MREPAQPAVSQLVFIMRDLPDMGALLAGLPPGMEVHLLDSGADGLAQMAALLAGRGGIDAIHLLSHGSAGRLALGTAELTANTLDQHASALRQVAAALNPGADLLLYGCDVGAGAQGAALLDGLALATGAAVAASSDATGGTPSGGNWLLETQRGLIDTAALGAGGKLAAYDALLATNITFDFGNASVRDMNDKIAETTTGGYTLRIASNDVLTVDPDTYYLDTDIVGMTGSSLWVDYLGAYNGMASATYFTLSLTGGQTFDLTSLRVLDLEVSNGYSLTFTTSKGSVDVSFTNVNVAAGLMTLNQSVLQGVSSVTITRTGGGVALLGLDDIALANISQPNTPPGFIGATTLSVAQNAGATSLLGLLHVSDVDAAQTLTWSQNAAPAHGTLNFSGATAASGSSNVTPGGTISYTPAAGYSGTDTFAVQVSDGISTVPRTITVSVTPTAPGAPDLATGSDSGGNTSDNLTGAATLNFSGAGATGDSASTVRVFIDKNNDGVYDVNDASATATMSNGGWSVSGVATATLSDGSYSVYAQTTSATGSLTSTVSSALSITIDKTAPAAPSAPDLATGSDSGSSSADNYTNVTTPTFTGTAEAGATVTLYDTDGTTSLGTAVATGGNWSITSSTLANGVHTVSAKATDAAGNVSAALAGLAVTVATAAPTLSITSNTPQLKAGETAAITFTFSADPGATFTWDGSNGDVVVTGGTLSAISGSGLTRTATFTPAASTNAGTASITVAGGSYADAANNSGGAGATPALTFDTLTPSAPSAPDLAAGSDSGASSSDDYTNVTTPTFTGTAESGSTVTLYDNNGITVLGTAVATGGNWSITSSTLGNGAHTVSARATDAAGNVSAASAGLAMTVATAAPTLAITSDKPQLKMGEAAIITFTFSADPGATFAWDGSSGDVVVSGGTLGAISGSGLIRTAAFTPTASTNGGTASITVAAGSYADAANNPGGAGTTPALTFDTLAPAAPSAPDLDAGSDNGVSSIDNLTGDTTPTFTGTAESGATVRLYDTDGTTELGAGVATGGNWSITSAPLSGGSHTVSVKATDAAGNAGTASAGLAVSIDATAPALAITSNVAQLKSGETATITFTFSEDPGSSFAWDGTTGDVVVSGGTLSAIAGTGLTRTATFTPAASTNGGTAGITVAPAAYSDAAGNDGAAGTTPALTFDTLAPAAPSTPDLDTASDTGSSTSDNLSSDETPTFSGTAESGATVTLYNAAGNVALGTAVASGGNWSITSGALAAGSYSVYAVAMDSHGNAGPASSSLSFELDRSAPAAPALALALDSGSSASDRVTSDGTVTVSGLDGGATWEYSLDGGNAWNAGVGASVSTSGDGPKSVQVRQTDAAGNTSLATTLAFTVDTAAPVMNTISLADTALLTGETTQLTISFARAVTGLGPEDISAGNGSLGAFSTTDGGLTWQALFTPTAGVNNAVNVISLDMSGVSSLAGAAGSGTAVTANYTVDTTAAPPVVTPPTPPGVPSTVDGVQVLTQTTTDPATGLSQQAITIPVITTSRPDDPNSPNQVLADIPLGVTGAGGVSTQLLVSLPTGTGLQADGPATLLTKDQALLDLIRRIENRTDAGSSTQLNMTGLGKDFLGELGQDVLLQSRTLIPTVAPGASAPVSIVITGGSATPPTGAGNPSAIGLVIDARSLPANSVLQLNDVDFAAIVGSATLRGGDGQNFVIGDGASQNIFLGADDDFLSGGAGNDFIGSAGGNDQLDGGADNDLVAGGIGNDRVAGGSGNDVLQGGRSVQGDWQFMLAANGALTARHDGAVFAAGQSEAAAGAELNLNAAALSFLQLDPGRLIGISLLYHAAFGRAPDLGGIAFWARSGLDNDDIAAGMLRSPEWLAQHTGQVDDGAFISQLYRTVLHREPDTAGLTHWLAQMAGSGTAPGASRADLLSAFAQSAEHRALASSGNAYVIGAGAVAGENDWFHGSGDDRLEGGLGNDTLVGGDGIDTAVYAGRRDGYQFIVDRDGLLKVADRNGSEVDTLTGIETGSFEDSELALGILQGNQAQVRTVGLLYQAVLDRAGDLGGLQWWLSSARDGGQLAAAFAGSQEFKARYDALSDAAFVQALFSNSGLAAGAAGGTAHWDAYLAGHSRTELIGAWIADADVSGAQFAGQGLWVL